MLFVYGLHTRRGFEMALGSGTNEPVNHWRAVHQRVREFWRLLSGSGTKHDVSHRDPVSPFRNRERAHGGENAETLWNQRKTQTPGQMPGRAFVLTGWYGNLPRYKMAPQEQPHSNHSRSSHPPTALRATGLTCFGGNQAAGPVQTASMNPPESRRTDALDAWFDHAAGVIIVRRTYRLPVQARLGICPERGP
jgi:hypothetical protein